jgi:hypothetical protein
MQNNLILRLSNGLGNQLFMYASAFAIAKQLNRNLLIDNETAFESRNNIRKYELKHFNISSRIAPDNFKFKNFNGYLYRKILKRIDQFKKNKSFLIEKKNERKVSHYSDDFLNFSLSKNVYMEGHFETESYFKDYKNDIANEFSFDNNIINTKNDIFQQISNSNSVCLCIRQGRYNDQEKYKNVSSKINKSWTFTLEQINYSLKCVENLKKKLNNPKFFLWSNDFSNLDKYFPQKEFTFVKNSKDMGYIYDLYLMTLAKHYVVVPTSFNWWGAWLSQNRKNAFILRPCDSLFSEFFLNNNDFWPSNWVKIK